MMHLSNASQTGESMESYRGVDAGKENLPAVGSIRKSHCAYYGTYSMRCVAHFDLYPDEVDVNDPHKSFHPMHWGCAYRYYPNNRAKHCKYYAVSVPISEDNEAWLENNKHLDLGYFQNMKESGLEIPEIFPVSIDLEDLRDLLREIPKHFLIASIL